MTAAARPRLLGDVGGTHARFAWQRAPAEPIEHSMSLPCRDHATLEAAIRAYLGKIGKPTPQDCAIGIATRCMPTMCA